MTTIDREKHKRDVDVLSQKGKGFIRELMEIGTTPHGLAMVGASLISSAVAVAKNTGDEQTMKNLLLEIIERIQKEEMSL